jgi:hypothetical protein
METDKRNAKDRRKEPTPGLSRYSFFGRRRGFRRKSDQQKGGYVDRYSSKLFFALILILALNVLAHRGTEINPIVRVAIEIYGDKFWLWKFSIVSTSLVLLCLHIKFRGVRTIIVVSGSIYVLLILYQIFLITYRLPATS